AVKALWDDDPEQARSTLDRSLDGARNGLGEARRAIQALRASPLEEEGLASALSHLGAAVETRSAMRVEVSVAEDIADLEPELEQALYRIADEALTNATRHSGCTAIDVVLRRKGRRVRLEVRDDGTGFDPKAPVDNGHVGIRGMRERAAMLGGRLDVESSFDSGTVVSFEVEVLR
ncbi:MAG: sensor histidine kinase, partial [Acidimicrobiia bacterium]